MARFTPLRIGCLDSEMTAERSFTSRRISGEFPPRSLPESGGDSTARLAVSLRGRRFGTERRRRGLRAGDVNKRRLEGDCLNGRRGEREEVEQKHELKRAIAISGVFWTNWTRNWIEYALTRRNCCIGLGLGLFGNKLVDHGEIGKKNVRNSAYLHVVKLFFFI